MEKAKQKLRAAEKLLDAHEYDDAVSRAYYAVFHAAQAVLLTEDLKADTHRGLVNLFGLHFVKTGKVDRKYGKYLANLKDDRETSDYEVFSPIDEQTAKRSVGEAREFLEFAADYINSLR